MKTLSVVATLVTCFLLCGFEQESSSIPQKPGSKVASASKQKAGVHSAASPGQPATAADKDAVAPTAPRQSDKIKVEVTALPPEIAIKQIRDSIDCTILYCTIVLTIVGVVGMGVGVWTLLAIKDQAKTLHQHSEELRKLAEAARDNAAAASKNAEFSRINAEATHKSAEAARLNAQAVINSERPWLVVRPFVRAENLGLCLFGCHNHGITPAKIVSASARYGFVDSLADLRQPPDYSSAAALPDLTLIVRHDSFPIGHGVDAESLIGDGETRILVDESRKFLVYYGNVVYRDVLYSESQSEGLHETRWCFVYRLHKEGNIKFEQTGPDGYNLYT